MQNEKHEVSKTNQNQGVTTAGNSWIICKSKTYPGKYYYFNTVTGQAKWNLGDAEAERAKKRAQSLNDQSEENLKECPEPQEPPMDNNLDKRSQYIYNKKVINNRFSSEPSYPIAAFVGPPCNYVVPSCNSGTQIGLNLPTQNYNPEVWAVPPTHQILIAPAVSPVISQSQMSVNMQYSDQEFVSMQQTSVPLTKRFQNNTPNFNSSHKAPNSFKGHKFTTRNKFGHGKFQRKFHDKPKDLREILSNKRKQRQSVDADTVITTNTDDSQNVSNNLEEKEPVPCTSFEKNCHIQESKDDAYLSETESSWLEENVKFRGKKLNLDIACLRNLAASDADPDSWYIAVDRTILLHHLNFLNMLISADDDCQLLVPREELNAVREMTESADVAKRTPRLSNRASRALDFVMQQFDSLCAVMGEELETNSTSSHILNCCLNVAEQNYHVILLSNDNEMLAHRKSSYITMFSMNELKAFLTKSKENDPNMAPTPAPESAIKITIPNDFAKDSGENKTFESISANIEQLQEQTDIKMPENNIEVRTIVNSLPATKVTIDTGVQTDFVTPTAEVKRREIKLRRTTPNKTSNNQPRSDQSTGVKQFRWRRKKISSPATNDASNQTNGATLNTSTSTSEDLEKTSDVDSGQRDGRLSAESGKQNNICRYENMEGSDSSSSIFIHRSVHERIVIEETSTSGVISNTTASNHDAESETNDVVQCESRFNCNTEEQEDKIKNNYMFKITSQLVEEYLRMRSDEWISRFVQIMEEVLSQVLQQQNPTSFHLTPPPWNLQEALQCILRAYDYGDVKDAAELLSHTLFNISDDKGKINVELSPTDFMEMYSYGVYLVDALQGTDRNCEDLQTASESLAKLLKDIQDPNVDTGHNDTFGEENQDVSVNVPQNTEEQDDSMKIDKTVDENDNTHYNLRSRKSTPLKHKEPPVEKNIEFVQNSDVESNFFNSLHLQKNISEEMGKPSQVKESTSQEFIFERPPPSVKYETNGSNIDNGARLEDRLGDKESSEVTNTTTKFLRRFSKSLEFEDRLSQREPLDLDELDYSANYDDNYVCMEDDYSSEDGAVDQSDGNHAEDNDEYIQERYPVQSPDAVNGNTVVCEIFQTFINKVKGTLKQVQEFCENTDEQLFEVSQPLGRRKAIHEKATKTYHVIENIVKLLDSVVNRESNQPQKMLQTAGIEGFNLNNTIFSKYRDIVNKVLNQANILLEVVDTIMSDTKT